MFDFLKRLFRKPSYAEAVFGRMEKQFDEMSKSETCLLEAAIIFLKNGGPEDIQNFYRQLAHSDVFVLCDNASDPTSHVSIRVPQGRRVLAVFTTNERAQELLASSRGGAVVKQPFRKVLLSARSSSFGIVINPMDDAVRVDIEHDSIPSLIEATSAPPPLPPMQDSDTRLSAARTREFTPDPRLAELAKTYALACREMIASQMNVRLDYTAKSVEVIEHVLQLEHTRCQAAPFPDEEMARHCRVFGSYLGEAYRHLLGAEWGLDRAEQPALRTMNGWVCYPWTRVRKRLVSGEEDSVVVWFHALLDKGDQAKSAETPAGPPPLPKAN